MVNVDRLTTIVAIGTVAAVVYYLRRPLAGIGSAVGSVTESAADVVDTVLTSPIWDPEVVGDVISGIPADVGRWLNPGPEPPPPATPVEDEQWLYFIWQDSGEYHPIYNP